MYDTKAEQEKVVVIGVEGKDDFIYIENSLDELEELVNTAGGIVIGRMIQKRESIHRAHYFGKGKVEELRLYVQEIGATGIVCDDELTANQMKNLQNLLNVKVMNRTLVILDIFAKRANSAEGKLQVELAQLKYNLSHLVGQRENMSRLGAGIGTRGPGEKKLEIDRRNISDRIAHLKRELTDIEKHRSILRDKRLKNQMPIIALVGYTNAGKSTLMNCITSADVFAEDELFATLDTTTRKFELESGNKYLFTDTVGFIQKLPHNLIQAFRATLEEIKFADVLVHVVDISNPSCNEHISVVYKTLKELNVERKPIITVFNKADKQHNNPLPVDDEAHFTVKLSAKNNIGVDELLIKIDELIKTFKKSIEVVIPYYRGEILDFIHNNAEVVEMNHLEDGTYLKIYIDDKSKGKIDEFVI